MALKAPNGALESLNIEIISAAKTDPSALDVQQLLSLLKLVEPQSPIVNEIDLEILFEGRPPVDPDAPDYVSQKRDRDDYDRQLEQLLDAAGGMREYLVREITELLTAMFAKEIQVPNDGVQDRATLAVWVLNFKSLQLRLNLLRALLAKFPPEATGRELAKFDKKVASVKKDNLTAELKDRYKSIFDKDSNLPGALERLDAAALLKVQARLKELVQEDLLPDLETLAAAYPAAFKPVAAEPSEGASPVGGYDAPHDGTPSNSPTRSHHSSVELREPLPDDIPAEVAAVARHKSGHVKQAAFDLGKLQRYLQNEAMVAQIAATAMDTQREAGDRRRGDYGTPKASENGADIVMAALRQNEGTKDQVDRAASYLRGIRSAQKEIAYLQGQRDAAKQQHGGGNNKHHTVAAMNDGQQQGGKGRGHIRNHRGGKRKDRDNQQEGAAGKQHKHSGYTPPAIPGLGGY